MDVNEPKEVRDNQEALINHHEQETWPFDYKYARGMRDGVRVKRQFSFTEASDSAFREFLEIYTGTTPIRGKGIGSAILELFMKLGVAIISDFKLEEVGTEMCQLITNPSVRVRMSKNMEKLAKMLIE